MGLQDALGSCPQGLFRGQNNYERFSVHHTDCMRSPCPALRSFCLELQTTGLIKQTLPIYMSNLAGPVYHHSFHESKIEIPNHAGDQWDYPSDLAPLLRLDFPSLDFLTLLGVSSIIDPAPHCPGQNAHIGE